MFFFQKSKLHSKDTDVASAHEKINQKSPIGSELEHVKQKKKKDVVAVHMIGRHGFLLWRHRSFTSAEMITLMLKLWYSSKPDSL